MEEPNPSPRLHGPIQMTDPDVTDAERLDVLMVSQPVEYGVAVCVAQLTRAAVEAGHRVTVASPGPEQGPLAEWVKSAGADHVAIDLVREPGWRDLGAVVKLRKLARGRDLVHLHSSKAGAIGRIAVATMRRSDRPAVVFTPHYWSWQVGGRLRRLYVWVERLLARRTDAIVAVSEQEAAEGRRVISGLDDILRVVPNGVDRARFSPEGPRANRDPDSPLLVCVGRLSRQKGQDVAIRALSLLRDDTTKLRLVGDENPPGERARLTELAEELGVADRIEWIGQVSEPAPQFRAADIVIAPSRWEGMSLVFLEGMACGAVMIVADVFGSQAVEGAGIIVDPDDPSGLAGAIDRLMGDPAERERLGRAARERSRNFDVADTLAANIALWAEQSAAHTRTV